MRFTSVQFKSGNNILFTVVSLHIHIYKTTTPTSTLTTYFISLPLIVCRTGGMKEENGMRKKKENKKVMWGLEEREKKLIHKVNTVIKQFSSYYFSQNFLNKYFLLFLMHMSKAMREILKFCFLLHMRVKLCVAGSGLFLDQVLSLANIDDIDTHGANLLYCGISFNFFYFIHLYGNSSFVSVFFRF